MNNDIFALFNDGKKEDPHFKFYLLAWSSFPKRADWEMTWITILAKTSVAEKTDFFLIEYFADKDPWENDVE